MMNVCGGQVGTYRSGLSEMALFIVNWYSLLAKLAFLGDGFY